MVATAAGIVAPGDGSELEGEVVSALVRAADAWAVVAPDRILHRDTTGWHDLAVARGTRVNCLLPRADGLLAGVSPPRVLRVAEGEISTVVDFDEVDESRDWYNPAGPTPDTRSLAATADGVLLANVHVGGILRSPDGGATWAPTIDFHADVHQVRAHPERPEIAFAAAAVGLALSGDGGVTWHILDNGLHATYLRAVALAGDALLVSASNGPRGDGSAIYRCPLAGDLPFERCAHGLPEWLVGNVDTHALDAAGDTVAFADRSGAVYASDDAGRTWDVLASGLATAHAVTVG